jgi:V/A-type H+-transporting ATPase subunit I
MYGLPNYHEMDPTPFVAITYFVLFGIMFADVGQGLCLSLIAWFFMWKKKKMELGRSIALCGLSSAVFGVLFGSVFGFEEALNPFWGWVHDKTGIPLNDGKLINVSDSETVITLIYAAIGIGVVLVLIAMLLNVYTKCKQHKYGNAFFSQNGLAGFIFYGATIFGVLGQMFLGIPLLSVPYVVCLIVIPLIVIFFAEPLSELVAGEKEWFPKHFGDFLTENIFEMIEVLLSYVSNTVSFLRVGAFILVHAGMMTVVFTLAEMMGGVGYWITVVLGNGIIMALEALLVGIQALRLEYYEMFSRFFTGDGRPFRSAASVATETKN